MIGFMIICFTILMCMDKLNHWFKKDRIKNPKKIYFLKDIFKIFVDINYSILVSD